MHRLYYFSYPYTRLDLVKIARHIVTYLIVEFQVFPILSQLLYRCVIQTDR